MQSVLTLLCSQISEKEDDAYFAESLLQLVELFKEHCNKIRFLKPNKNPATLPLTSCISKLSFQKLSPTSHWRLSLVSFHAEKIVSSCKLDAQLDYVLYVLDLTNTAVRKL